MKRGTSKVQGVGMEGLNVSLPMCKLTCGVSLLSKTPSLLTAVGYCCRVLLWGTVGCGGLELPQNRVIFHSNRLHKVERA